MKYMLVNVSPGNLQVDLFSPDVPYNKKNLHRLGPVVGLSLKKGTAVDILPHFGGSIEKAHAAIKHSQDVLKSLRPGMLHTYVCGDDGKRLDAEALLGGKVTPVKKPAPLMGKPKPSEDVTKLDVDTSAVMAAQDQFEAQKTGEANPPPVEAPVEPVVEEPPVEVPVEPVADVVAVDSFRQMEGVGEATEQKLHEAGYNTFASLAEASLDSLAEILGNSKAAKNIQKQAKKLVE